MPLQNQEKKALLQRAITSLPVPKNLNNTVSPKKIYTPSNIDKEAEKIFIKNNQNSPLNKYKNKITGSWPKLDEFNYNTPYGKEVRRVQDQVKKTREVMSK